MPMRRDQYYRSVRERTPLLRRITEIAEEPTAVIRGSISSALEGLRHDEEAPISKTRGGFIILSIGLLIFLQGIIASLGVPLVTIASIFPPTSVLAVSWVCNIQLTSVQLPISQFLPRRSPQSLQTWMRSTKYHGSLRPT